MRQWTWCLTAALVTIALAGCDSEPARKKNGDETSKAPSAAAAAVLVKADTADGTEDKVVNDCVMCSLKMAGKPEYAVTYNDYTIHFCSLSCKESFEKNPEKALLSLKLPEEKT
jgi:YHS domain-containing protein